MCPPATRSPGKGESPMRVRMLAGAAVAGLLVALLSPMAAFAQAQTTTVHFSGTESAADVNRARARPGRPPRRLRASATSPSCPTVPPTRPPR
jgi:hypothetical protein